MASWAAILALTGFQYSAVTRHLTLAPRAGRFPWSTGYAWGTYTVDEGPAGALTLTLTAQEGTVRLSSLEVRGRKTERFDSPRDVAPGSRIDIRFE
jgi:hypothetical protein